MQSFLFGRATMRGLVIAAILSLASCATSDIRVAPDLVASADVLQVTGRSDIRWKSKLSFGEYTVMETRKTFPWQSETEFEFLNRSSAGQKFNLEFENRRTRSAGELVGRYDLETKGVNFRSVLPTSDTVILSADDLFVGAIHTSHARAPWTYEITNMTVSSLRYAEGVLVRGSDVITIEEITELDGAIRPGEPGQEPFYGLEFSVQGRPVAAVQYHSGGKVWLSRNLPEEYRDVISMLSSAVILKQES